MTLGQKLKALLKESAMTQEDLAERLEVSRQAVGKWINDKGMPEVAKLIQISDLFGVTLDYLLKEECTERDASNRGGEAAAKEAADKEAAVNSGYYVSKEMLDGYLSYSRQRVKRVTGGIGLFMLSNIFICLDNDNRILMFLYWFMMIAGISILLWTFLQTKQYQEIKRERLILDDEVFREFQRQREGRRKKYAVMMIAGVVILFGSTEIEMFFWNEFERTVGNVFSWLTDTIWIALIVWAGMSMRVDSVIVQNAKHAPKNGPERRYRWIYAALPVTALAVLIGVLTNAWSPYAPIIILFCCLLATTCKLLIEGRKKD